MAKSIEVIDWYLEDGTANLIRFRLKRDDESYQVIKIDKIIKRDLEKLAGNLRLVITCISVVDGIEKLFEIKYELASCKWILFKM